MDKYEDAWVLGFLGKRPNLKIPQTGHDSFSHSKQGRKRERKSSCPNSILWSKYERNKISRHRRKIHSMASTTQWKFTSTFDVLFHSWLIRMKMQLRLDPCVPLRRRWSLQVCARAMCCCCPILNWVAFASLLLILWFSVDDEEWSVGSVMRFVIEAMNPFSSRIVCWRIHDDEWWRVKFSPPKNLWVSFTPSFILEILSSTSLSVSV